MSSEPPAPFTGRRRNLKPRWSVRAADLLARAVITVGGLGTIVAVSLVAVFLVIVALPLFLPGSVSPRAGGPLLEPPKVLGLDEAGELAWSLAPDGSLTALHLSADGPQVVSRQKLFDGKSPTVVTVPPNDIGAIAVAFADGTARVGRISFETKVFRPTTLPDSLRETPVNHPIIDAGRLVRKFDDGRWEARQLLSRWSPDFALGVTDPRSLDYSPTADKSGTEFLAVAGSDAPRLVRLASQLGDPFKPMTADVEDSTQLTTSTGPLPRPDLQGRVFVGPDGEAVYHLRDDGKLARWTVREGRPDFAEQIDIGKRVTAASWLAGKGTLLVGDSAGGLSAWFRVPHGTGERLVRGHEYAPMTGEVRAIAAGPRHRVAAIADATQVRVLQTTSHAVIGSAKTPTPIAELTFAPNEKNLAAIGPEGLSLWKLEAGHPEATPGAMFAPVWYERYPEPGHTWDPPSAEPKYGFVPLVFGTLKATFYAMLFAAPLAILAAIFTSEFLGPRGRGVVKPVVEVMAGLPSVVLGLIGALVVAPILGSALPAFLLGAVLVPIAFVIAGQLWELVPHRNRDALAPYRLVGLVAALLVGGWLASVVGPLIESWLFPGGILRWLNEPAGAGAFGGWVIALLPVSLAGSAALTSWVVGPRVRSALGTLSQTRSALLGLGLTLFALIVAGVVDLAFAGILSAAGLDLRGNLVGKYDNRNALLVGIMLGFAVIPIIYTIADDALRAVPDHLRAASLACGATPWQTAVRVVVPTALSGLFAALMIGLGRAVGETMIALLCLGRTPIIDVNPFNGATSLAITVAAEMPETARGGTHFRTLFLAGLVLFALTFVVNTIAEGVRLRFRKRAHQL